MPATDDANYFLTPKEVADLLRVPVATVYGWRTKGLGPPAGRVGRHVRYRREAVLEWARNAEDVRLSDPATPVRRRGARP